MVKGSKEHIDAIKRANTTHGDTRNGRRSSEYGSWDAMRRRCSSPKHHRYQYYGARGIKVCKRWEDFSSFLADMGRKPSLKHTLDRINNDGDYEPGNCKWSTAKEQANNRSSNIRQKEKTKWGD